VAARSVEANYSERSKAAIDAPGSSLDQINPVRASVIAAGVAQAREPLNYRVQLQPKAAQLLRKQKM
jgi:hypothetical protein